MKNKDLRIFIITVLSVVFVIAFSCTVYAEKLEKVMKIKINFDVIMLNFALHPLINKIHININYSS